MAEPGVAFAVAKAEAHLKAEARTRLSMRTSAIPLAVHARYAAPMRAFMASGERPSSAAFPEFDDVATIARKEQTAFRNQFRAHVTRCEWTQYRSSHSASCEKDHLNHNRLPAWAAAAAAAQLTAAATQGPTADASVARVGHVTPLGTVDLSAAAVAGLPKVTPRSGDCDLQAMPASDVPVHASCLVLPSLPLDTANAAPAQAPQAPQDTNRTLGIDAELSALVALALLPSASYTEQCSVPLEVLGAPQERTLRLGLPAPAASVPRKAAFAAALQDVVSAQYDSGTPAVVAATLELQGPTGAPVVVRVPIHAVGRTAAGHPVAMMAKAEYSIKGYNTVADDAAECFLERLSSSELATALLTLQALPEGAALHVVRVNAYTEAIAAVEVLDRAAVEARAAQDADPVWPAFWQALHHTVVGIASATAAVSVPPGHHVLVKPRQGRALHILPATPPPFAAAVVGAPSDTGREYLAPCVWPWADRIPMTFPPRELATTAVNRTRSATAAECAAHDEYSDEVTTFTPAGWGYGCVAPPVRKRYRSDP